MINSDNSILLDELPDSETVITLSEMKVTSKSSFKTRWKERVYNCFKRIFDVLFSSIGLVLIFPLLLIVIVAIKVDSKGPAIYRQRRVGKNGKYFTMYKFRSMVTNADDLLDQLKDKNECDGPVFKISNDPRLTKVGIFIRKYSIDELPQIINILKGDMSIVGPRPPLINEVEQYTEYEYKRLSVKPGLTCYWQISGRSDISFQHWIELDLKYINERSLWTDAKIIIKTFPAVLGHRGAY